ncbi:hypothetical protein Tco_0891381 [Tanacetum coccineum]|uniref:Reverse transcriptase domain-containing protein n=1 Tax=Tanacetum coccineum TaxID=301880 RepID=A0ABQ5C8S7_9ASTR
MSADSAVTYTSVHYEARSWSIPSEDPYEHPEDLVPQMRLRHLYLHITFTFLSPRIRTPTILGSLRQMRVQHHPHIISLLPQVLRRAETCYVQESMEDSSGLVKLKLMQALEARVTVLEIKARRHEWQRQATDDLAVQHNHAYPAWSLLSFGVLQLAGENGTKRKAHEVKPGQLPHQSQTLITTTSVTSAQLQAMIDEGVTAVLAARATTRNGDDSHTSGTGVRRNERAVRECTYQDFMKCQPLFFRGTEGVVDLTQWFERMETVFRISTGHRG